MHRPRTASAKGHLFPEKNVRGCIVLVSPNFISLFYSALSPTLKNTIVCHILLYEPWKIQTLWNVGWRMINVLKMSPTFPALFHPSLIRCSVSGSLFKVGNQSLLLLKKCSRISSMWWQLATQEFYTSGCVHTSCWNRNSFFISYREDWKSFLSLTFKDFWEAGKWTRALCWNFRTIYWG